jgi:hypothetical protein
MLTQLEDVPWERVHIEVKEGIAELVTHAEAALDKVSSSAPEALPGCAALMTGVLATQNTFSPLDGEDYRYEAMTEAVWTLNRGNEGRFYPWLWRGFAPILGASSNELDRWVAGGASASTRETPDNPHAPQPASGLGGGDPRSGRATASIAAVTWGAVAVGAGAIAEAIRRRRARVRQEREKEAEGSEDPEVESPGLDETGSIDP